MDKPLRLTTNRPGLVIHRADNAIQRINRDNVLQYLPDRDLSSG